MDAVHGRSGVTKAESHRPTRTVGRRCSSFGVARGDVVLVSSITRSLYHQSGKSWTSLAWRCFVYSFIHENGTTALASSCYGAPVTLREARSPCALCRGDRSRLVGRKSPRGRTPRRAFWLDALSRRGPSPRVFPWRESPGLKSLSRLREPGP